MRTSLDRRSTLETFRRATPRHPRWQNPGLRVIRMIGAVWLLAAPLPGSAHVESEKLSMLLTEPKLKISGFGNGAFLDADTDCAPIAESAETIEEIVLTHTKIEEVRSYLEAYKKVVGTLSLPETMSKRDRDFIIRRAKNSGDTVGEMANAAGAMIVSGQLVFWRLLSDQSLLVCTAKGELGEMVLLTR